MMSSTGSHVESPRATNRPSRSFSRPSLWPIGSSRSEGISEIGVSAGASKASYIIPVSTDLPDCTSCHSMYAFSATVSVPGMCALQIDRVRAPSTFVMLPSITEAIEWPSLTLPSGPWPHHCVSF